MRPSPRIAGGDQGSWARFREGQSERRCDRLGPSFGLHQTWPLLLHFPKSKNLWRQLSSGISPPDEVFTPEDFTEQHQLIGQTAEEFAVNEILPNIGEDRAQGFLHFARAAEEGWRPGLSGVEIPEAYGGLEMDKVTAAVIADHIAKYAGFATTWGAHSGIGLLPIVYFGTEEQKKKYLPRLAAGEIVGAYALSEASSGSDALNCRARASFLPTASITF
jgi:alkylation response protein AidB-like acyl-CoA dehydrogenase